MSTTASTTNPSTVPKEQTPLPTTESVPSNGVQPQSAAKIPINPGMDAANKTAAEIFNSQGKDAFIKHVFTDQETGRPMSYGEMRMLYG